MILHPNSFLYKDAARQHGLPLPLLLGLVSTESGFDTEAARYEKGYRWTVDFDKNGGTAATEKIMQQISWGLMQIMGATARYVGFDEPWLGRLTDPGINLEYGCTYFTNLLERWHGSLRDAVAAYNAGSVRWEPGNDAIYVNQAYVDKVFSRAKEYGLDE